MSPADLSSLHLCVPDDRSFLCPRPLSFHPVLFISAICLQLTFAVSLSPRFSVVLAVSGKRAMTVVLAVDGEVTLAGAPSRLNTSVTAMETKEAEEREEGEEGGARGGEKAARDAEKHGD